MKTRIIENITDPEKLEQMFHDDQKAFESGFNEAWPEIANSDLAQFWKVRLGFDNKPEKPGKSAWSEIFIVAAVCLFCGFLIKIPDIFNFSLTGSLFYEKNAALIACMGLIAYTAWLNRIIEWKRLGFVAVALLLLAVYVNLLPATRDNSSVNLVYIHMPLLLWFLFGLVWIDFDFKNKPKRVDYIRYNGDLAIMAGLIMIAGGILTVLSIGLFDAIGINAGNFYMKNIVVVGFVSLPVIAAFVIRNYAVMISRIAPVIAVIFSPLVLISAVIYLAAIVASGKDPYTDREFLLLFNLMLLGVMAIIVFSISATINGTRKKFSEMILLILSSVTVIIDLIALSAIFYRLGTFGITPNRLAVLGSNILILINLVLIIIDLFRINFKKTSGEKIGLTISNYLPVYSFWILFVVFLFPIIFGIK